MQFLKALETVVGIFEKFEHTFEFKSIDKARRIIRGVASLEEEDRDGEIVAMEALDGSLKSWLANPVIRFKHTEPIGRGIDSLDGQPGCYVDFPNKAFIVTAYISDQTQAAKDAWGLIQDGVIKSFSVGGKVLEKEAIKQGERQLNKITKMELYEVSVCDIPSNRKSFFSVIAKSIDKQGDYECPKCGKKFDTEESEKEHEKDCTEGKCPHCGFDNNNISIKGKDDVSKPGVGTHSAKWDRCVAEVRARGGVDSPEAVCTAQLGEESFRGLDRGSWSEKDSEAVGGLIEKINKVNADAGEVPVTKSKTEEKLCNQIKQQGNLELELKTSLLSKLQKR